MTTPCPHSLAKRARQHWRPISLTLIWIFTLLLFFMSKPALSDDAGQNGKSVDLPAALQDLQENISRQLPTGRPLRLAVLVFIPTRSEKKEKSGGFGEYLSESILGLLSHEKEKIRLFERKRLDLILAENSLTLSGLINPDQAKQIGDLVPVDAVLSGTFTKLGNRIDIHSRVVDVVTGEILLTHFAGINLTDDLKSFFDQDPPLQAGRKTEDVCATREKRIGFLLNDLSSADKIQNLVKEAVAIPFEGKCAGIHYAIMRSFEKYSIDDPDYEAFLMKSIAAIPHPSADRRACDTLTFMARNRIDAPGKWELCLAIVKKSSARSIGRCLRPFIHGAHQPGDLKEIYRRIDAYDALLVKKEIGLPAPLSINEGFIALLDAADDRNARNHAVSWYAYKIFRGRLTLDKNMIKILNDYLARVYLTENNETTKREVLYELCDFYNTRPMDESLADDLYRFAFYFNPAGEVKKDSPDSVKAPSGHLVIMLEKCRDRFCRSLSYTKFDSQKHDRISFCVSHRIDCPPEVPTPESAMDMLSSKDWSERVSGMAWLAKMGTRAKIAESRVITALKRTSLDHQKQNEEIHRFGVIILGNIRSTDPKALELLIECLGSLEYNIPQLAQEALVSIGKPAVPYLIKGLESEQGSVQYKSAKALGLIGPEAAIAVPALRSLMQSRSKALQTIAREALEAIGY
ncbi:MAG: FlgO family outer membrane protein [Smithellaceae bacterium]